MELPKRSMAAPWMQCSKRHYCHLQWTMTWPIKKTLLQKKLIKPSITTDIQLLELQPGQEVKVKLDGDQGWKTPAEIISKAKEPRSYLVEMDNSMVTRRNRWHLQPVPETASPAGPLQQADPAPTLQDNCLPTTAMATPPEPSLGQPSLDPAPGSPGQSSAPQKLVQLTSRG